MDETATIAYRRFAAELGVLFQIVDDILDVTGHRRRARQAAGQRRAPRQAHVRHASSGSTGARELAARVPRDGARDARARRRRTGAPELEQITDFILTRTT